MSMELSPQTRWTLATRHLGWEVRVFEQLESTNSYALSLAGDPSQHGLITLARAQTSGRGQYGRTWTAPANSSVLATVLVFPPPPLRRPAVMTAWAAVAVSDVVQQLTGMSATIKWPNDILVNGKKVCGLLIEQRNTGNEASPLGTAVGIGLNVAQSAADFEAAGLPDAASLASMSGQVFAVDTVAKAIFHRLDETYEPLLSGDLSPLESIWQWRFGLIGKLVAAELADGDLRKGMLLDIGFDGVTIKESVGVVNLMPETIRQLKLDVD